ncbi:MAG TPA: menaquinone biosynthesis protein [Limnochordia bacterium]|nr:menaquinone biosynthesis protein [Limnochordia bacterium]
MAELRIGGLSYLNSAVFFHNLGSFPADIAWTFDHPTRLGEAARRGELDCALLSLADYVSVSDHFSPLLDERQDGFGIGTRGPALSVLLFSREPLGEWRGRRVRVATTTESATSIGLLSLLARQRYGAEAIDCIPSDAPLSEAYDAALVIGNAALAARRTRSPFVHLIDLAEAWWDWQRQPFVFALWAARRDLAAAVRQPLAAAIARNVILGLAHADEVGRCYCERTGFAALSGEELARYVRNFQYRLGPREWHGLSLFLRARDLAVPAALERLAAQHATTGRGPSQGS